MRFLIEIVLCSSERKIISLQRILKRELFYFLTHLTHSVHTHTHTHTDGRTHTDGHIEPIKNFKWLG